MKTDYASYMRNRRAGRRNEAKKSLGDECVNCGKTEELEFDHIDPSTKIESISHPSMLDGKEE